MNHTEEADEASPVSVTALAFGERTTKPPACASFPLQALDELLLVQGILARLPIKVVFSPVLPPGSEEACAARALLPPSRALACPP